MAYTAGGGCTGSVCVGLYIVAKWSALIAERRKERVRWRGSGGLVPMVNERDLLNRKCISTGGLTYDSLNSSRKAPIRDGGRRCTSYIDMLFT